MPNSKIVFTNALLEGFGRTRKNGAYAKFSAPLTQNVIEAMGWDEIADWTKATEPDIQHGELAATNIELDPNERELRKLQIDVQTAKVFKFKIVSLELEGKRGQGHRLEVRFKAEVADEIGCRKLEEFMMGVQKCRLTIGYVPAAKQGEMFAGGERVDVKTGAKDEKQEPLPLPLAADSAGCPSCDAGIDILPDQKTHLNGEPCVVALRNMPVDANAGFVERSKEQTAQRRRARAATAPPNGEAPAAPSYPEV